jgi:translation initiation factor 5B
LQAKRELAKKEGRYLTKKQKEERQVAELRKQALLASGVQIEGLQQPSDSGPPKKVVYDSRKKKPTAQKVTSPISESRPRSPEPVAPPTPTHEPQSEAEEETKADWEDEPENEDRSSEAQGGVKDAWDASSDEEKPSTPEVKDSWDDSSDAEEAPAANGKPVEKSASLRTTANLPTDILS